VQGNNHGLTSLSRRRFHYRAHAPPPASAQGPRRRAGEAR
jgi:hypothetical protein